MLSNLMVEKHDDLWPECDWWKRSTAAVFANSPTSSAHRSEKGVSDESHKLLTFNDLHIFIVF